MNEYKCSHCGADAYYDGRCGDGPVLVCECSKRGHWHNDGRGGYWINANGAEVVPKHSNTPSGYDYDPNDPLNKAYENEKGR